MKVSKYLIALVLLNSFIIGFNNQVFSWGIFNLFSEEKFTQEGLQKAKDFNPDKDILYLPTMYGKTLFQTTKDLSICRRKSVRKFTYIYLTRGRSYAKRSIERSYIYNDIIQNIFEENKDIPVEISLLPLLESGFNPYAVSRSNAVGLWQFMKNTSRPLGLKKNRWVDERRNIEKSTRAAIRHLRGLYHRFNSWELALAAYNGGAGHVSKAMKKTGETNYWDLRKTGALHKETAEYVPRYIALLLIYQNQRLFEIQDEINIPRKRKIGKITLNKPMNLKHISQVTNTPAKVIKKINPELKLHVTPPYHKNYVLHVPQETKEILFKKKNIF